MMPTSGAEAMTYSPSGDDVGEQPAFQPGNLILQFQLALLQPLHLQLVGPIGLQPRDIVIELNGTAVTSTETLASLVGEDPSIWRVEIERDGQRIRQFFR